MLATLSTSNIAAIHLSAPHALWCTSDSLLLQPPNIMTELYEIADLVALERDRVRKGRAMKRQYSLVHPRRVRYSKYSVSD